MSITLRPVQRDDLGHTHRWHSDQSLWQLTGGRRLPITPADEDNWYADLSNRNNQAVLIIDSEGEPVGLVGLYDIDWVARSARSGLMVDPLRHGEGIGTIAYALLIEYAQKGLGLQRLWAMIVAGNHASLQLHNKLGFENEGLLRQHWLLDGTMTDVVVVGRLSSLDV